MISLVDISDPLYLVSTVDSRVRHSYLKSYDVAFSVCLYCSILLRNDKKRDCSVYHGLRRLRHLVFSPSSGFLLNVCGCNQDAMIWRIGFVRVDPTFSKEGAMLLSHSLAAVARSGYKPVIECFLTPSSAIAISRLTDPE